MTVHAKPQPRISLLHQQLLGGMLANKMITKMEVRGHHSKLGRWEEREIPVATPALAGCISELSIERAARRWAPV